MNAHEDRVRPGGDPPATPPHRVRVPVNIHDWQDITFLHWPVEPSVLAGRLPEDLAVLTHAGSAWVSVTPFFIRVRPPRLPAVRGLSAFPETNVRTYVVGPGGHEGLWFLHMEVTRAWFVAVLRALGLPYVRRDMTVERVDGRVSYRSSSAEGPSHRVAVRTGLPLEPASGEHPPWPLHVAQAERCDVQPLLASAGLPDMVGPPLVHFSPGVTVRVGRPTLVRRQRDAGASRVT